MQSIYKILRAILRACVPESFRTRLYRMRAAARLSTPMILEPTYAEDGLISQHSSDFIHESRFQSAYEAGRDGIVWSHPGEIRFRAYIACWAAQQALSLDGDFVECGVATGILSRTICTYVNFGTVDKKMFLFDTFRGIPIENLTDAREIEAAHRFNKSHYAGDVLPLVKKRFSGFPNVIPVQGVLPDSLGGIAPDRIAYLSIDLNNAVAEMGVINALWDRLVAGAIVLLDDYAYGPEFSNQKQAWDAFAHEKGIAILTLPTGQGMIVR